MILDRIKINSYKSIVDQEIELKNNCTGFIGLNESGKTNILKAINYLDYEEDLTLNDKSKINGKIPSIEYHFTLDDIESKEIKDKINSFLKKNRIIIGDEEFITEISFKKILFKRELLLIDEDYKDEITIDYDVERIKINDKYYIYDKADESNHLNLHIIYNDERYTIEEGDIVHIDYIDKENHSNFVNNVDNIKNLILDDFRHVLEKYIPEVKYWEYSPRYLIPSEIKYDEFMKGHLPYEVNAPLYNMLLISNLDIKDSEDISQKITEWKADSSLRRKHAKILTNDVNKHIKNVWEKYDQEINIDLEENKITIHVNDPKSPIMNYYDMDVRSQGFKTFVSFILTISAEVKHGGLNNSVILLDEPETHLHPSGVKYMKEELLKLAKNNNYVFYATHSIFMIDRSNLDRHIIVKKENEETKLKYVNRKNILQEEVIYQALGTHLDEFSMSNNNIVFEGELDQKLFSFFMEECIYKDKNNLVGYEFLDGGGTSAILKFFSNKSLIKGSKWTFVLDNDTPGRNLEGKLKKGGVLEEYFQNFKFCMYSETNDFELEDILDKKIIENAFNSAKEEVEENFGFNINQDKPISNIINEYYNRNNIPNDKQKEIEKTFKTNLDIEIDKLLKTIKREGKKESRFEKFRELLPDYFTFLDNFLKNFEMNITED